MAKTPRFRVLGHFWGREILQNFILAGILASRRKVAQKLQVRERVREYGKFFQISKNSIEIYDINAK